MRLTLIFALIASPAMAQSPFGADSTPNRGASSRRSIAINAPGRSPRSKSRTRLRWRALTSSATGAPGPSRAAPKQLAPSTLASSAPSKTPGETPRKTFETFANWFKQNKVDIVVANGDIALDEFDLEEVFLELGKLNLPVIVFAGNSESRTSFNLHGNRGRSQGAAADQRELGARDPLG